MWRRLLLAVLLLPFLAGAALASAYETLDLDWVDASRQRSVPVRLYWPGGEQPVALVVFSHGIGGSRRGYSYLGEHFASRGVASLHLQHVGSDRSLWGGNPFSLLGRLQDAAREGEALERVRDLRFALDQVLAHETFGARIDRARIAAAGHSYGANTVMLASGAAIVRDGRPVEMRDARIRAAVLLSAPPFYGEKDPAPILRPVTLPTLHITATDDTIRIPGFYSPVDDRLAVFEAVGSPFKALAVFEGGSHSIFTNRRASGGAALNARVKEATRELALAFLQRVFDGSGEALERWPQTYAALLERWVSRPSR
ncbi:MAG: alpha/beta fold hydrolase [Betaproteobacteria bacterium]|nr:alpha/beta fold hydrolase [Betaproteobacteria bacterium]